MTGEWNRAPTLRPYAIGVRTGTGRPAVATCCSRRRRSGRGRAATSLRPAASLRLVAGWQRTQQREEDDVADRRAVGEEHGQPVDPDPLPRRRRHAVFEGAHVVLVVDVGLGVAGLAGRELLAEALGLHVGVVELREGVRDLHAPHVQLEAFDEPWVVGALLGELR